MGGVSPPFSFGHPDEANWLKCLSPSPCFVDNGWEGKEKDVCASQPASAVPRPPGRRAGRGFPLRAAGGPDAPEDPRRVRRPGVDPGGGTVPLLRPLGAPAAFPDLLGSPGVGQDDARPHHRRRDESGLPSLFGGPRGHQGDQGGPGGPQNGPNRHGASGDPVHRRDPPLQQGPAGRPAPLRGGRNRHPVRDHDGEPLLRDPERSFVPLPGSRPRSPVREGRGDDRAPRPHRPGARARETRGVSRSGRPPPSRGDFRRRRPCGAQRAGGGGRDRGAPGASVRGRGGVGGNAAPGALQIALAAAETYRTLGSPEGELALAQATVYLATAPKSNRVYVAFQRAMEEAKSRGSHAVPTHLRNAPTRLMKDLGYGKRYQSPHDFADAFVPEEYFPETLGRRTYYEPSEAGHEKVIASRLRAWWGALRKK